MAITLSCQYYRELSSDLTAVMCDPNADPACTRRGQLLSHQKPSLLPERHSFGVCWMIRLQVIVHVYASLFNF
jgi:hypothetical protein